MQHVIRQELGHTLGSTTSSETKPQNTCMDYYHNTSASDTKSTHPNAHDNEELIDIYRHLDSTSTVGGSGLPARRGAVVRLANEVSHSKYVHATSATGGSSSPGSTGRYRRPSIRCLAPDMSGARHAFSHDARIA